MILRRAMMSSLPCLTVAFLVKGLAPVASFVSKQQPSAVVTVASRCYSSTLHCHQFASSSSVSRPSFGVCHRFSSVLRGVASASASVDADADQETMVPITLLSGFLGSGKTSTLQHLLENKDGLKIGVIVNDVASVNIDAKLIKNSGSSDENNNDASDDNNILARGDGIIELQNGCACCSLADELLPTVETLLNTKSSTGEAFDAVVIELSGVGDPIAIQQHWKNSKAMGAPITQKAELKRVVTLIDASTFGTDWMTWDVAGERDGWTDADDDCAAGRKVPELLAEQIEAADILLLNKIDLAGPKQVDVAEALARSINNKAVMEKVEFGKVLSPKQIIRDDKAGKGDAVVEAKDEKCTEPSCTSHDHSHSHSHEASSEVCEDSDCGDPECSEHGDASSATTEDCSDADCTDETHDHSHTHSHSKTKTHTDNLGIVSFVYRADRPFESRNLMSLLNTWPVPIKEDLEGLEHFEPASAKDDAEPAGRESAFFGVLRSKGFCWLAPTMWKAEGGDEWRHDTAMYWSHAGKHFGVTAAGKWWATLDQAKMKEYFKNDPNEYERIQKEDFVSEKWGDRRQEIVFIGANIDEEKITKALDNCLLGDKGMERYIDQLNRLI